MAFARAFAVRIMLSVVSLPLIASAQDSAKTIQKTTTRLLVATPTVSATATATPTTYFSTPTSSATASGTATPSATASASWTLAPVTPAPTTFIAPEPTPALSFQSPVATSTSVPTTYSATPTPSPMETATETLTPTPYATETIVPLPTTYSEAPEPTAYPSVEPTTSFTPTPEPTAVASPTLEIPTVSPTEEETTCDFNPDDGISVDQFSAYLESLPTEGTSSSSSNTYTENKALTDFFVGTETTNTQEKVAREPERVCTMCWFDPDFGCSEAKDERRCEQLASKFACAWDGKACGSKCWTFKDNESCRAAKACAFTYEYKPPFEVPPQTAPAVATCMPSPKAYCMNQLRFTCEKTLGKPTGLCKGFVLPVPSADIQKWFTEAKCDVALITRAAHGARLPEKTACERVTVCLNAVPKAGLPLDRLSINDIGCETFSNVSLAKQYADELWTSIKDKNLCLEIALYGQQCVVNCKAGKEPGDRIQTYPQTPIQIRICGTGVTMTPWTKCPPDDSKLGCGWIYELKDGSRESEITLKPPSFYCLPKTTPPAVGCAVCKCTPMEKPVEFPSGNKAVEECFLRTAASPDQCVKDHGAWPE